MIDRVDLVKRRAYVRVYSGALGHEDAVMDEGWVVGYLDQPSLLVERVDGRQGHWATSLRIVEVPEPMPRWTQSTEDLLGSLRGAHETTMKRRGPEWSCPCGVSGTGDDRDDARRRANAHERQAILAGLADAGLLVQPTEAQR